MPLDHTVPTTISTTFRKPEDLRRNDITSPQLFEWHAKENPDYPLFVYHDGSKLEYITYSVANRAIDRAARFVASTVGANLLQKPLTSSSLPVVAIFANADTISYFCTYMGVIRAGCTVFLVSTRNGSAAVADMLQRTGAGHIIVSADDAMRSTAADALSTLSSAGANVTQLAMPTFEDLFAEHSEPGSPFEAQVQFPTSFDMGAHATIMHSSGSTGHPKTIYWTHATMAQWGQGPLGCEVNVEGTIFACHGSPMFHGLGTYVCSGAAWTGFVVGVFKPTFPPTLPIPDAVWEGLVAVNADYSWSVPSFIEEWARDPEKVLYMKKMRGMMFGGAALNAEVGNVLARSGVSLFSEYGCTEAGMINEFARPNPGLEWEYWKPNAGVEVYFRPVEKDMCEIIVLSPRDVPLAQTNTKIGDRDAYATSDLAVPHPTKPGFWKIIGRADEQIVLSNGEKTNPLPLEKMINDNPFVKSSVMFGRGKFQNGVLIEPAEDYVFDATDVKQLEAFRNAIWPTIERVNEFAPQHSRIFKEMIMVTSPSKPFEFTAKNQPRRNFILQQYHDEIEALYKEVESSAQGDLVPPSTWDPASTLAFVRAVVEGTLGRAIADDADIFRSGGDSLQATWIRNTILRAIRETDKAAAPRVPMNLVFAAPTIASLAHVIHDILHSESDASASRRQPQDLWDYVAKYSADLPPRPANLVARAPGKDVVVITGTTGGFGCDTLEHLLNDEKVERVYAFNRKGAQAMERQRAQFRARGLNEALLDSPKFRMVEAVLHEPGFGLNAQLLDEIRTSVTHIMHNAWKVNFNMSIASFEVDIQGARNFVDLALSSPYTRPPSIIFVSSIGTFANCTLPPPVPEVSMNDPAFAFGSGYSESKWVTEHMLETVSKQTDVHTVVMRLGQVAGDRLGYWNEKEWFPSLVKSALFQHCLPDIEGTVAWFPAYEAAKAFAEMRHSEEPFLHLVHPNPTTWHTLMAPIAQALGVPLVSYKEWLATLESSVSSGSSEEVETMKRNPALRILPFFKAQGQVMDSHMGGECEPMGFVYLSTEKAAKVSDAFTKMPQLDGERSTAWVTAWKKSGFLN